MALLATQPRMFGPIAVSERGAPVGAGVTRGAGGVEIAIGLIAIAWPIAATAGFVVLLACSLLTVGTIAFATAYRLRGAALAVRLVTGAASIVAGSYLVADPERGAIGLTTLLVLVLFVAGGVRIVAGMTDSRRRVLLAIGVFDIVLGSLIWADLPSSANWVIGLLLGLHFLVGGIAIVTGVYDEPSARGRPRGLEVRSA